MGLLLPLMAIAMTPQQRQMFQNLSPQQQQMVMQQMEQQGTATGSGQEVERFPVMREKKSTAPAEVGKKELKRYGYDFFADAPNTFAPASDIPIPADYRIGPSDNIEIELFGSQNERYQLTVGRDGSVAIPSVGPLRVAGLSFSELRAKIERTVQQRFVGVNVAVNLGELRSIRVFVLGEAYRPGSYTVSALSTLSHILYLAGGVTEIGSLRNIELKRAGERVATLDLYDLFMRGDSSDDRQVQAGDVIFIPPIGESVAISGEVVRPAIYELSGQTTVAGLVEMAGGYTANAYPNRSRIERVGKQGRIEILSLDLTRQRDRQQRLHHGDLVQLVSVLDQLDGAVLSSGMVERPGVSQWYQGVRISDLFGSLDDLKPAADLTYGLIKRENSRERTIQVLSFSPREAILQPGSPDDLLLKARDEVIILAQDEQRRQQLYSVIEQIKQQRRGLERQQVVSVVGAVTHQGDYPFEAQMRVSYLVRAAMQLNPEADVEYALIQRESDNRKERRVIMVNILEALNSPGSAADVVLQPEDRLNIFYHSPFQGEEYYQRQLAAQQQLWDGRESKTAEERVVAQQQSGAISRSRAQQREAQAESELEKFSQQPTLLQREPTELVDRRLQVIADLNQQQSIAAAPPSLDLAERRQDSAMERAMDRWHHIELILLWLQEKLPPSAALPHFTIHGLVKYPGRYPLVDGADLMDMIHAAGGLTESAYPLAADLTRYSIVDNQQRQVEQQSIDLAQLFASGSEGPIVVKSYDVLQIKRMPEWFEQTVVSLEGEFRFPGSYVVREGETLTQLIERAGGLSDRAFLGGSFFSREQVKEKEQLRLEQMVQRMELDVAFAAQQRSSGGSGMNMEGYSILQDLLLKLRSVKAMGRVVINLESVLSGEVEDIRLKDGDRLIVPKRPQEVSVIGEIQYATSHIHHPDHDYRYYIQKSGGTTYRADESRIYIIRADGTIESTAGFWSNPPVLVGDTIVVPLDVERVPLLAIAKDVSQILADVAVSAAALTTIGVF